MRKSILTLGTALALGALATGANAVVVVSQGQGGQGPDPVGFVANTLVQNPAGTGHVLYAP